MGRSRRRFSLGRSCNGLCEVDPGVGEAMIGESMTYMEIRGLLEGAGYKLFGHSWWGSPDGKTVFLGAQYAIADLRKKR
jgi:hypothetical protein